MYELLDARTFGLEIPRPLIIADEWRGQRRKVYDFPPDQLADAVNTLKRLNGDDDAA